jgi:hypothetical protein
MAIMSRRAKVLVAWVGMLFLSGGVLAAESAEGSEAGGGYPAIVWVGTVATDLLYVPAKLAYAGVGAVTGAFGWLLTGGDTDVTKAIWNASLGGTYVVTPAMLEGKEKVYFSGS